MAPALSAVQLLVLELLAEEDAIILTGYTPTKAWRSGPKDQRYIGTNKQTARLLRARGLIAMLPAPNNGESHLTDLALEILSRREIAAARRDVVA
jgi:hypothetical protein